VSGVAERNFFERCPAGLSPADLGQERSQPFRQHNVRFQSQILFVRN
jgi:hypothetical protein